MAANSPTPAAPPASPILTSWDEYLAELGLTRAEQQELDSGKLSLYEFIDCKAREEARVNAAFYREAEVDGNNDVDVFVNYVIDAIDLLGRYEDDRYRCIPRIPGVLEKWLIEWVEERYDEMCAKERNICEAEEKAYQQQKEAMQVRLSTILEEDEYESED